MSPMKISKAGTSSSGSSAMSPDECEDEDGPECEENSEDDDDDDDDEPQRAIVWTGYGKKIPVMLFYADVVLNKRTVNLKQKAIGDKYHLAFKMVRTECKLIRSVLYGHGFHEAHPNSNDYNLMWTGSHLKPYVLRGLQEFQKINHFPRSYEITRKDRLYKNLQRMQQIKGYKQFDFIPQSFIVPGEFQDFCSSFIKDKGPWIVKPVASSRGRGIFLVNHPDQLPLDETTIVSKYISNPLLIDGFKFDLRIYVVVTSYDPLVIYMYEEGLTRFATVKYSKCLKSIRNQCMHLTNYSVNKRSGDYVRNDDPNVEDYGNKWSLGAVLRYLRAMNRDTTALMMRIEDVVIKTLISAELPIATACKMFMPYRGNCFELYGFDILIDDNLRPWILEVNLSPSLACDAPLDLKVKSSMIADMFSLVGFVCHDPMQRLIQQSRRNQDVLGRMPVRAQRTANLKWRATKKSRPNSANAKGSCGLREGSLTSEEIRIVRRAKEENSRRGGWVRIFPSPDSWELYGSYLQYSTAYNQMLHQRLFPDRSKTVSLKSNLAAFVTGQARTRILHLQTGPHPQVRGISKVDVGIYGAVLRSVQYERKLRTQSDVKHHKTASAPSSIAASVGSTALMPNHGESATSLCSVSRNAAMPHREPLAQGIAEPSYSPSSPPEVKTISIEVEPLPPTPSPPPPSVPPPPPEIKVKSQPSLPAYNIVAELEKGKTLSKVQARFAFATYLMRVQQRLQGEPPTEDVVTEGADQQMDLVLRFLRRAACNLQQPFRVAVPSRSLPVGQRRRILAKQLADFVHIYSRETELLQHRGNLEKQLRRPPPFSQGDTALNETRFNEFVNIASESELEDVLTTYTKLNKSASIFLGSSSSKTTRPTQRPTVSTATYAPVGGAGSATVVADVKKLPPSKTMSAEHQSAVYAGGMRCPSASVVFAKTATRQRPFSASLSINSVIPSTRTRPSSAGTTHSGTMSATGERERPDGAEYCEAQYDEKVINSALQRLAVRQQQRHYAASKGTNVLTSVRDDGDGPAADSTEKSAVGKSAQPARSANETFDKFVADSLVQYIEDPVVAAYSKVTGVRPQSETYLPSRGSTQYAIALGNADASRAGRALLARAATHHAAVAQAHATQRVEDVGTYVPKPPAQPRPASQRKPVSAHRMHRATTVPEQRPSSSCPFQERTKDKTSQLPPRSSTVKAPYNSVKYSGSPLKA